MLKAMVSNIFSQSTVIFLMSMVTHYAVAKKSASVDNSKVYLFNLFDGQKIVSPLKTVFGIGGLRVAQAGVAKKMLPDIGHQHLLINTALTKPIKETVLPFDEAHMHFGRGQTETTLNLSPGEKNKN